MVRLARSILLEITDAILMYIELCVIVLRSCDMNKFYPLLPEATQDHFLGKISTTDTTDFECLWARWAPNLTHMNACDGCPRAIYTHWIFGFFWPIEFYGSST